jgi:hypothetical protein
MMKSRLLFAVMSLILFLGASNAVAQIDTFYDEDPGIPDTVRIVCPTFADLSEIPPGDSIRIPIYIWSDYEMSAFGIGITFDNDYVVIQSYDTTGSALKGTQQLFFNQVYNPEVRHAYIGWVPFHPDHYFQPTGADTGAFMFALNMRILDGFTPECVSLDSAWSYPASDFVLGIDTVKSASTTNISIKPQFVGCACVDVTEFDSPTLPESFSLSQNSPNPFNPITNIDFALSRSAHVTIDVYNTLGQRVTTLVNEHLKAGYKRVQWDGTNDYGQPVASGIYFYRMVADDFSESKKMLLLK